MYAVNSFDFLRAKHLNNFDRDPSNWTLWCNLLGEDQSKVTSFNEKPAGDGAWINGGYFVPEPE